MPMHPALNAFQFELECRSIRSRVGLRDASPFQGREMGHAMQIRSRVGLRDSNPFPGRETRVAMQIGPRADLSTCHAMGLLGLADSEETSSRHTSVMQRDAPHEAKVTTLLLKAEPCRSLACAHNIEK